MIHLRCHYCSQHVATSNVEHDFRMSFCSETCAAHYAMTYAQGRKPATLPAITMKEELTVDTRHATKITPQQARAIEECFERFEQQPELKELLMKLLGILRIDWGVLFHAEKDRMVFHVLSQSIALADGEQKLRGLYDDPPYPHYNSWEQKAAFRSGMHHFATAHGFSYPWMTEEDQ